MLSDKMLDDLEEYLGEYDDYENEGDEKYARDLVRAARTSLLANTMLSLMITEVAMGEEFSLADRYEIVIKKAYPFLPPEKLEEIMEVIDEIRNGNYELINEIELGIEQQMATDAARELLGEDVSLQDNLDEAEDLIKKWVAQ